MKSYRVVKTLGVIVTLLIAYPHFSLQAADIVIRRKSHLTQKSLSKDRFRFLKNSYHTISFKTEEEKRAYIQKLDPKEYDWEPAVTFTTTEYFGPSSTFQQVVNDNRENDPWIVKQWSIFPSTASPDRFSSVDISTMGAWSLVTGSPEIVVYVHDSGLIDPESHPDLKGRVIGAYNVLSPDEFPLDRNGHGTNVASVIGAAGFNRFGMRGIAWGDIKIVAVGFLGPDNKGTSESAGRGMQFIQAHYQSMLEQNPNVKCLVNMSWGGSESSQFVAEEMANLARMGCWLGTSAGNESRNNDQIPFFPCNIKLFENTCVAASDSYDRPTSFTNYGPTSVDLLAPGENILGIGLKGGDDYPTKSGTSQALPHVTGVAALIWAANPKLLASDVRAILNQSVDRLPGAPVTISGGRLNAYRAVLMATGQDPSLADRKASTAAPEEGDGGGGCSLQALSSSSHLLSFFLFMISAMLFMGSLRYRLRVVVTTDSVRSRD